MKDAITKDLRPVLRRTALVALSTLLAFATQAAAAADWELGQHLASECVACHQASGRRLEGIPAIVGLPTDQFVALMDAYSRKQRENTVMQAIASRLSPDEIEALAAYYGSLKAAD
ncbi:MAG TPA: c-type cytochrome [Bosea sp. (in: a-proteobacteria)]|jgi:cytochrome c553|uniref:c-type cytochrome n=1 Tax=Bosea sp. (in: a-proteobacteria) TaxID=1871050 RepID=UPI002E0F0AD0|nr:c-type cytochrome [Bosea sp. (in: a-proteobacteria)]